MLGGKGMVEYVLYLVEKARPLHAVTLSNRGPIGVT